MPLTLSPDQAGFDPAPAPGEKSTFRLPFAEQIAFFRQKLNLPTEHWDDILKSAHDRAFVVAGAMKADLLADLNEAVGKAISDGKSIGWFRAEFKSIVAARGWHGWTGEDTKAGRAWRTRVIYTTNLRTSYAAGRYAQLTSPRTLRNLPYWKYVHNDTVMHPRPLHVKWGRKPVVLHHTDPWWQTHFPPNGWGCRCRVTPVATDEFNGDPAPDDGTYEKVDRNGEIHELPNGVDYGWDYSPGANATTSFQRLIDDKLIRLPAPMGATMWDALKSVLLAERARAVRDMVSVAAASMEPAGHGVVAHVIAPATVDTLRDHGVELQDAAIWLRDHELVHAIRDSKVDRGAALPLDVWLNLPAFLDQAQPYFDTINKSLLYAFDIPDRKGKVVVGINRVEKIRDQDVRKRMASNFITTGGMVDASNLKEGRYVPLK